MTQIISTGIYCGPSLLVSPTKHFGNYTNINTAIAASSAGIPVVVAPGSYSNNITLLDRINLIGYSQALDDVVVNSSMVTNDVLTRVAIRGMSFISSAATPTISVAGTNPKIINFYNCAFEALSGPVISLTTSGFSPSQINFYNCSFSIIGVSGSVFLYTMSGNNFLNFYDCQILSQGGSTITSNHSGGLVSFYNSTIEPFLSTSGTGAISAVNCSFNSDIGVACALNSSGTSSFLDCDFNSGTFAAVTVGASSTAVLNRCGTTSSNANPFSGAGTIEYNLISNNASSSLVIPTSSTVTKLGVALGDVSVNTLTLNTPPANGSLLIGNGSGFSNTTLTQGAGIIITNSSGNVTIASSGSAGLPYVDKATSFTASSNFAYFCTAALTVTLPPSPNQGDLIQIFADTAGTIVIQANTGQLILIGSVNSVPGGTATNTLGGNAILLSYRSASTSWMAQNFIGSWSVA